jgi:hypothetical protein
MRHKEGDFCCGKAGDEMPVIFSVRFAACGLGKRFQFRLSPYFQIGTNCGTSTTVFSPGSMLAVRLYDGNCLRSPAPNMTIVDWDSNRHNCGILFRKGRSGPEKDLLDWFLELRAVKVGQGERLTIFREPRLPSGFPDLVAVVWKESVVTHWKAERRSITATELRLMQHLATATPATLSDLTRLFGPGTERSLSRLLRAEMVVSKKNQWRAQALSRTFAIKRIVAIEAKVAEWRVALDQAFINTWFTPESYVLVPAIPKGASLVETALQYGIGVLSKEKPRLVERPEAHPRSYVSWLFNEWVWKLAT